MINYTCKCGAQFEIKDDLLGKQAECYKCGAVGTVAANPSKNPPPIKKPPPKSWDPKLWRWAAVLVRLPVLLSFLAFIVISIFYGGKDLVLGLIASVPFFWTARKCVKILRGDLETPRLKSSVLRWSILYGILLYSAYDVRRSITDSRIGLENSVKGSLSNLKTAITVYASENKMNLPPSLAILSPKYMDYIPMNHIPNGGRNPLNADSFLGIYYHEASSKTVISSDLKFTDEGGWLYNPKDGKVYVNCTHTDIRRDPINNW